MVTGLRIIVTGGSGKAGRYIIDELLKAGHTVLNLDLAPLPQFPQVATLRTDLTQSGQVFSAMTGQWGFSEPFPPGLPPRPDAVIHLANYHRNMLVPDDELFRTNTLSTYNVIEAACKLGVKKLILASSITVYGVTYAQGDADFPSFPVTEDLVVNPSDTYAISKMCGERVAQGFSRRFNNLDIYSFRIGHVIAPEEYALDEFINYVREPAKWKVHGWAYTDARDLGRMCQSALETCGLGFQVFNATNDEITNVAAPTTEAFLREVCPGVPFTRKMGDTEAPVTNEKMKRLLGFREKHSWKNYVNW